MYSTRAPPCRVNTKSSSPSSASVGDCNLEENRRQRASRGGETIDHVVVAPRRTTRGTSCCAAAMYPFFRLDRARVAETNLLHGCTEHAIDERSDEAAEDNRDHTHRSMTRWSSEWRESDDGDERRANRGRREARYRYSSGCAGCGRLEGLDRPWPRTRAGSNLGRPGVGSGCRHG